MNIAELTPDTIGQWTLALTAFAGVVGLVGSALANALPKRWPITQTLTQLFADLRAVRKPEEPLVQLPPMPPLPRPVRPPPKAP